MKVLFIADEESKFLWDFYKKENLQDIDLIVSCGDLKPQYLIFLVTMTNVPLLYVHGNHDASYEETPPDGCICIEDDIFEYRGVRFLGLGGCLKYSSKKHQYTEAQMRHRIWKLKDKLFFYHGFDVLVTHAPAKGYGDSDDMPHRGFECFVDLIRKYQPLYHMHGHMHNYFKYRHDDYQQLGDTEIINVYERCVLEIPEQKSKCRPGCHLLYHKPDEVEYFTPR